MSFSPTMLHLRAVVALGLLVVVGVIHGAALECKPFDELYENGKDLCETIFGDAFEYSTDTNAYTMWFFDKDNPNDAVTLGRGNSVPDMCQLQYFHKEAPGPEPETFTECHPWKDNSCCAHETVESADKLRTAYGPGYEWDRCGPLSQACERFFVQEACFYECDVNAGLFRRFPPETFNASNVSHNTWELYRMPIRADYCDAWFEACRKDKFCAADNGDFFSCAKQVNTESDANNSSNSDNSLSSGAVAGIVIAAATAVALLVLVVVMVVKERRGQALFQPLHNQPAAGPV